MTTVVFFDQMPTHFPLVVFKVWFCENVLWDSVKSHTRFIVSSVYPVSLTLLKKGRLAFCPYYINPYNPKYLEHDFSKPLWTYELNYPVCHSLLGNLGCRAASSKQGPFVCFRSTLTGKNKTAHLSLSLSLPFFKTYF